MPTPTTSEATTPDTGAIRIVLADDHSVVRSAPVRRCKAGVLGYILKEAADAELVKAVRQLGRGATALHQALDRGPQAQLVERGRAQLGDQRA